MVMIEEYDLLHLLGTRELAELDDDFVVRILSTDDPKILKTLFYFARKCSTLREQTI